MLFCTLNLTAQIIYPTGDDLFDSATCCTGVSPALPYVINPTTLGVQNGQYGILKDCALQNNYATIFTVTIFPHPGGISPPIPPTDGLRACDELAVKITVSGFVPGNPGGSGLLTIGTNPNDPSSRQKFALAKFVRTWTGLGPTGNKQYRFWLYMIEGDAVNFASSTIPPSSFPACWTSTTVPGVSFDGVVFRGYLNLMVEIDDLGVPIPGAPNTEPFTLVMSHYDGCLDHINIPFLNKRAIAAGPTKHVGTSYHLVTPNNFSWVTTPPTASNLNLTSLPHDSIRSTVSHTTQNTSFGQSPGPLCLAEMPLMVTGTTNNPKCLCVSSSGAAGAIDYEQNYLSPYNYGTCTNQQPWNSAPLIAEIPTGFTQTYLGRWGTAARQDVAFVQTTMVVGTVDYADHCAHSLNYLTAEDHIIWGNASLWPSLNAANIPTITQDSSSFVTDYMVHFGNHVDKVDNKIAGEPAYVNIIWNMFR